MKFRMIISDSFQYITANYGRHISVIYTSYGGFNGCNLKMLGTSWKMIVFLFYAETIILHDLKYNWYGKLDYCLCF